MSTKIKKDSVGEEKVISTCCCSHCGGSCILKVHVKDDTITRIETDDGPDPQFRGCLKGRAYRQRVYAPDRVLYPMKRVGERGDGKYERISWDEAMDTVIAKHRKAMETHGPTSILYMQTAGDTHFMNPFGPARRWLALAGGYFEPVYRPPEWRLSWSITSFAQSCAASQYTYGTIFCSNMREDLLNSKLIILWGCDPAVNVNGPNTTYYLAQAKEQGTRIISIDPRYNPTAEAFADQWIPIRPGTDAAMQIAMAYVMIEEGLHDEKFLETYTIGFDRFKDYVMGLEDRVSKTPAWAEPITGVSADTITQLAREYAKTKPAALWSGIAPGRSAYGEQHARATIALACMTGNVGIHGGDSGARWWESHYGGYPYPLTPLMAMAGLVPHTPNPLQGSPDVPKKMHFNDLPDVILAGKSGGFPDFQMMYVASGNPVGQGVNVNKIVQAFKKIPFIAIQEQFMTPTAKFADILLPVNTYMERNDITMGLLNRPFIGMANKCIEPLGESKSALEIAAAFCERMGIPDFMPKDEDTMLREFAKKCGVPESGYDELKKDAKYYLPYPEPYVAFKDFREDPKNNPLKTPSGKIEIYSQQLADIGDPNFPSIPKYIPTWENRDDSLFQKYPIQCTSTHGLRRQLSQSDSLPWLREVAPHAVEMHTSDAEARGIKDGDMVRVFNDRGTILIRADVSERIMPGCANIPHGTWYDPDENGVDRGGNANVLTSQRISPSGGMAYNTVLVQIEKAS